MLSLKKIANFIDTMQSLNTANNHILEKLTTWILLSTIFLFCSCSNGEQIQLESLITETSICKKHLKIGDLCSSIDVIYIENFEDTIKECSKIIQYKNRFIIGDFSTNSVYIANSLGKITSKIPTRNNEINFSVNSTNGDIYINTPSSIYVYSIMGQFINKYNLCCIINGAQFIDEGVLLLSVSETLDSELVRGIYYYHYLTNEYTMVHTTDIQLSQHKSIMEKQEVISSVNSNTYFLPAEEPYVYKISNDSCFTFCKIKNKSSDSYYEPMHIEENDWLIYILLRKNNIGYPLFYHKKIKKLIYSKYIINDINGLRIQPIFGIKNNSLITSIKTDDIVNFSQYNRNLKDYTHNAPEIIAAGETIKNKYCENNYTNPLIVCFTLKESYE